MPQFLKYFMYQYLDAGIDDAAIFRHCLILRDIGTFKVGDKVDAISLTLNILLWQDNDLVGDETEVIPISGI